MQNLAQAMRQHGLVRFVEHYAKEFPDAHLKDLVVDHLGPNREMDVLGRRVINFGSDSFLGLDQDPRVQEAIVRGVRRWGAQRRLAHLRVRAGQRAKPRRSWPPGSAPRRS